ncbi:hypothetical protein B0H19DRAFT_331819 [Mycena capillaripes]|nr:hypothetical protein B0H19DRAFT_331819 [Mycena capillaripes]
MADVSHNPFRTPAVSPNPTGIPRNAPPSNSTQQHAAPPAEADLLGLTEEAPPAYTTRPDVYQGESTIEYGPSRPFQPAPPPLQRTPPAQNGSNSGWIPQQRTPTSPAPSLWQQLTGQITGSSTAQAQFPPASWSAYPGGGSQRYAPPQQPPPPQPTTHISDFARDFYATTTVPPGAFSDVSGVRATGSGDAARYPPPPTAPPSTQTQYQPPPGAPPPAARTPSPNGGGGGLPDDGSPTTTPVPGHPLLHNGNMLVYPPHYECSRCNNTGYKHADPTRPCHKCWSRYARPYSGALAYAPPSSPSSLSSSSAHPHGLSFQRPLPRLYAPPRSPAPGSSPSSAFLYPPPPGPGHARASSLNSLRSPSPTNLGNNTGMTVYAPGDPRMGGAPCWRCGGRGAVSFLIFETVPCSVCRGVGRVFR